MPDSPFLTTFTQLVGGEWSKIIRTSRHKKWRRQLIKIKNKNSVLAAQFENREVDTWGLR